jgi:hypothetical protein
MRDGSLSDVKRKRVFGKEADIFNATHSKAIAAFIRSSRLLPVARSVHRRFPVKLYDHI